MQVSITSTSVGQILNADLINMDRLSALSPEQQTELISQLAVRLQACADAMAARPNTISTSSAAKLAHETKVFAASLSENAHSSDKKESIGRYLTLLRTAFGDVADVL